MYIVYEGVHMNHGRSTRQEEDDWNYRQAYEDYIQVRDEIPQEVREVRHDTVCRREIIRLTNNNGG